MTVLRQIGVLFEEIKSLENINLSDFAVIVISSNTLTKKEEKVLYDYTAEGGAVICEAKTAKAVFQINLKISYTKFLYSESDELFYNFLICDLYNNCKIPGNSNHLENQNKIKSVLDLPVGKGNLIVFPEKFVSSIHKSGSIRKNFYSEFSIDYTSEQVALVTKGVIRLHIEKALEYLFHKRGLPFVHLWFYPYGARNIFSLRIDTDMGSKEEINSLFSLLQNYNISATWFVETKSSQNRIELFSKLYNQEISYHCYRHRNFLSYKKNMENIEIGLKILENAGIKSQGYASPYGEWNKTIARAVDNFDFLYSSEFSFAYDSLPLYPYFKSDFSKVMQIPIHPVSIGRLYWGGHSEDNMVKYFLGIIRQKLLFNEPIILYTHPFEKKLNVFAKVFETIISYNLENKKGINSVIKKIPILTFSEFAEWWNKRLAVKWSAEEKNGKVLISAINPDASIRWRAIYPSGEKYILSEAEDDMINIDKDKFEFHPNVNPYELRRRSLRMIKYDIIGKIRKLKQ